LNPWYCPPRFLTSTADGLMDTLVFQNSGAAAKDRLLELCDDLVFADYNFPGRGTPLSALRAKSVQALEGCGLQEVPGIVEWIKRET